jgi:hypothetical protein
VPGGPMNEQPTVDITDYIADGRAGEIRAGM